MHILQSVRPQRSSRSKHLERFRFRRRHQAIFSVIQVYIQVKKNSKSQNNNPKNKYVTTIEEPALNESGIEAKKKGF